MFQLYIGLVRGNDWYNHATVGTIRGGSLAVLDSADRKGTSRLLNLIKGSCKSLFTEDGKELVLKDSDYHDLKVEDSWKIALESICEFTGQEFPMIEEHFFCKTCSSPGNERYTETNESWNKLIEDGFIDEHFLDKPDCSWKTELPVGFKIEANRLMQGGDFNKIVREPITLGQMIKLQNIPTLMNSEASLTYAVWDAQIKSIDGMDKRDLNIHVKRDPKDSFCRKHLIDNADIEAMDDQPPIGIDAKFRQVSCKFCNTEIGGYLDFTNFFSFLSVKKSGRNLKTV